MFRAHPLWVSPLVSLVSISQGDSRSSHATEHKFDINNMLQTNCYLTLHMCESSVSKNCVSSWSASHRHPSLPRVFTWKAGHGCMCLWLQSCEVRDRFKSSPTKQPALLKLWTYSSARDPVSGNRGSYPVLLWTLRMCTCVLTYTLHITHTHTHILTILKT